jgi:hypothetical protein
MFFKKRCRFFMRGTRKARGIEAKPPAKHGTCDAGDVADSPTRGGKAAEAARPTSKSKIKHKN